MRINKINNVSNLYTKNSQPLENKLDQHRQDSLEISTEARDYQLALKKLKELPDLRQDRVEELKAQVQAGEYKVDSQKIAEKMLGKVELLDELNEW